MDDLKDLAQVVTKSKLRSVKLLSNDLRDDSSMIARFYDMILEDNIDDDQDAANILYQKNKNHPAYQKLRKTVKDRLIDAIFLIDLKEASYNNRQKAYYECYRDWAAAKILFGKNARRAALLLCRKILKISRKYEFTELNVDITHTLRLFFGTIIGDLKEYNKYNELFKFYQNLWIAENQAEEFFTKASIGAVKTKSNTLDNQHRLQLYLEGIQPLLKKYDSYQLHLYARILEVNLNRTLGNNLKIIDSCNEALNFFKSKPYTTSIPFQIFSFEKLNSFIQLRQFNQAFNLIEECKAYFLEGTHNWFKLQELYFYAYMHNGHYKEAKKIILIVTKNSKYTKVPAYIKEFWKIATHYIHVLSLATKFLDTESNTGNFRLSKLLNELDVLSKDKKGMNVSIKVLNLIYYIVTHKYDKFIDQAAAINEYRRRHLQIKEMERSNLFFELLLLFPKHGFQKKEILEEATPLLKKLESFPIELSNQPLQIEIVPYETLWKMIMEFLSDCKNSGYNSLNSSTSN
jgi:hypothetical protein